MKGMVLMTEIKSNRGYDSKLEKIMQSNFDKVYNICGITYSRCTDRKNQLLGSDLVAQKADKSYNIDEKCATDCFGRDLKTFALELSAEICDKKSKTSTGKRVDGWFLKEDSKTDVYAFAYVRANSREDIWNNNIKRFEVLFVKKQKLIKYISEIIGTPSEIKKLEENFRNEVLGGKFAGYGEKGKKRYKKTINKDFALCWSIRLAESPVNLLISKSLLRRLSFKRVVFELD